MRAKLVWLHSWLISLLQRYHDGKRTRVWAELLAQGEAIRAQPLYDEAEAVVREIMQRARHNIELLVERLNALEYRFVYPTLIWTPPDKQSIAKLRSFEKCYDPLPLSLRLWHEIVGPVNFMGTHPRFSSYEGRDWDGSQRRSALNVGRVFVALSQPIGESVPQLMRVDPFEPLR